MSTMEAIHSIVANFVCSFLAWMVIGAVIMMAVEIVKKLRRKKAARVMERVVQGWVNDGTPMPEEPKGLGGWHDARREEPEEKGVYLAIIETELSKYMGTRIAWVMWTGNEWIEYSHGERPHVLFWIPDPEVDES